MTFNRTCTKQRALLVTSAVLLTIFTTGLSQAASPSSSATNVVLSPPTFDLTANPGDSLKESIRLDNTTDQPLPLTASLDSFVPLGTDGAVNLTKDESPYSLSKYITLEEASAVIPPKGFHVFNFTIDIPTNAEPGGRFGSVVFSTGTTAASKTTIGVSQQVASLVLLRVSGNAVEKANISSMAATYEQDKGRSVVVIGSQVHNSGNVQVKPIGTTIITDMFGRKATSLTFNSRYVLPGANRDFKSTWKHGFIIGRYTATQTLIYGSKNKLMSESTSFTTIPFLYLSKIIGIVAVVAYGFWRIRKRVTRAAKILFSKDTSPVK